MKEKQDDRKVIAKYISDLDVDEMVLDGENSFSKVISFLHRVDNLTASFVRLHFTVGKQPRYLTLTPRHLVLVQPQKSAQFDHILAQEVKEGDLLKYSDYSKSRLEYVKVDRVERVELENSGIYSPLTESGTIIVDNVHVSCFSMVKSHRLAAFVFNVVNSIVRLFEMGSEEFFVSFTEVLFRFVESFSITSVFLHV